MRQHEQARDGQRFPRAVALETVPIGPPELRAVCRVADRADRRRTQPRILRGDLNRPAAHPSDGDAVVEEIARGFCALILSA